MCVGDASRRLGTITKVRVFVGGLPQKPTPPLNYRIVFSLEDVQRRRKGEIGPKHRSGRIRAPLVESQALAATTSGAAAHSHPTSGPATSAQGAPTFQKS